jgi:hypothetical protein
MQLRTLDIYGKSVQPEQRLWQAVLWQLIEDKFNEAKLLISQNKDVNKSLTSTFGIICNFAGYSPEYMNRKIMKALDKMQNIKNLKKKGIIWNV